MPNPETQLADLPRTRSMEAKRRVLDIQAMCLEGIEIDGFGPGAFEAQGCNLSVGACALCLLILSVENRAAGRDCGIRWASLVCDGVFARSLPPASFPHLQLHMERA